MNWLELYRDRVETPEESARHVESFSRVFLSGNCATPKQILAAIVARAQELRMVEICQILTFGTPDYVAPELAGHIRVNTLFIGDDVRAAVNEGRADFTPVFLSEIPRLFTTGRLPLDVALIQVSPPDDHGFCSFGVEVAVTKTAALHARHVIAEVNPHMPRTLGDSFIHISKIHSIVPVDYQLRQVALGATDPVTERIADHVAGLIPDGATLQTGIGAVPDAVLKRLTNHRDLGIHTELFSDGVIDLVNRGIINGEKKTLHPGKIVAGFIIGTQKLYDFVHDNPIIELHPTEYVNDPFIIAQNYQQIAINSAIEIDLTGQVCSDSIGPRLYSGVGGQVDFIYGASRSKGGIPIIAIPSVLEKKNAPPISRITPLLKHGAGVVTTRNHVHYVVTENGVADLYGRTIMQRARALIQIAAPEFREELEREARRLRYIP